MAFIPVVFGPLPASYTFEHCYYTIFMETRFQQRMHIVWICHIISAESTL